MKDYEPVPCCLCGNQQPRLVLRRGQFGSRTYVSICPNDGLVFLNPRWTAARYLQYYATEYDAHYRSDQCGGGEPTYAAKYDGAERIWHQIGNDIRGSVRAILDIGCGNGYILEFLAKQLPGCQLAGIEPSECCREHAAAAFGIDIVAHDAHGNWDTGREGRYDLVILNHTLEHLMQPLAVLQKIRRVLSARGHLYVVVPNMMSPNESLDRWFRPVHTYFFSESTLVSAAAAAGFSPVLVRSLSSGLSEVRALFRPGAPAAPVATPAVYQQQLATIRQFRRRELPRDLVVLPSRLLPRSLMKLIPESLKSRFR